MRKILPPLLFLAGVVAAFLIGRHIGISLIPEETVTIQVDTLIVHDTLTFTEPVEVERVVRDTMFVEVSNTVVYHDTTYLPLPREYVTYQDSAYRAVVSGFIPRLEEIEVYPTREIITIQTERVIKPSPWALSVQGGYGISAKGLSPYIGVGISYNLYNFPKRKPPH